MSKVFILISCSDLPMQLWFATTLRDGIAISASGGFATFRDIASSTAKQLMAKAGCSGNSEEAAADIIGGFEEVQAHSDVLPGLQAIHKAGIKVTMLLYAPLPVLPQGAFELQRPLTLQDALYLV